MVNKRHRQQKPPHPAFGHLFPLARGRRNFDAHPAGDHVLPRPCGNINLVDSSAAGREQAVVFRRSGRENRTPARSGGSIRQPAAGEIRNPNLEIRNNAKIQISNDQNIRPTATLLNLPFRSFRHSEIRICFGFRISSFGFRMMISFRCNAHFAQTPLGAISATH